MGHSEGIGYPSSCFVPDESQHRFAKSLAEVTLQTFYLGKVNFLKVYMGKLNFLSVTDFSLGNLPQGNFIVWSWEISQEQ